jgi:hypothetical protein
LVAVQGKWCGFIFRGQCPEKWENGVASFFARLAAENEATPFPPFPRTIFHDAIFRRKASEGTEAKGEQRLTHPDGRAVSLATCSMGKNADRAFFLDEERGRKDDPARA